MLTKKADTSSDHYLSLLERQQIASWHDPALVCEKLHATSSDPINGARELRRTARTLDRGYKPVMVDLRASERAKRPKVGKIEPS